MSLHKIGITYMGMPIWVESGRGLDQYEEAGVIHAFNRDFAHMLKASGQDVRAHFDKEPKTCPLCKRERP
jgi:hypothetical protein